MLFTKGFGKFSLTLAAIMVFGSVVSAQTKEKIESATANTLKTAPRKSTVMSAVPLKEVKGISIGMTVDEVTKALGKPEVSDDTSMYYQLSDNESVQVRLDADKKVYIVSVDFSSAAAKAPDIKDVFGPDVQVQAAANGKIYKLVRYPEAGYWVSYSRINLANGPVTTITINKL